MFFQLTPTVRNLLILNVGLAIIQAMTSVNGYMTNSPIAHYGSLHHFGSDDFYPFQIFTHMFLHGDARHIMFNMVALVVFGPMLEQALGEKRFLIMYIVCGIGAGLFYSLVQHLEVLYYYNGAPDYVFNKIYNLLPRMLGASGATFGLLAMAGLIFPNVRMVLMFLNIPVKIKHIALFYGGFELLSIINRSDDGIAHYAHVGGAIFAFILFIIWKRQARRR